MRLPNSVCVVFAGLLLLLSAPMTFAADYEIALLEWQQPRSGSMVRKLPGVQAAIAVLRNSAASNLLITHQSDEEGALWGAELHDWLVSLGIPPVRMQVQSGDVSPAALRLSVVGKGAE